MLLWAALTISRRWEAGRRFPEAGDGPAGSALLGYSPCFLDFGKFRVIFASISQHLTSYLF